MISNDDIFQEVKDSRKENSEAHEKIYNRLNTTDERMTRCEERQKTIWGVMAAIGGAILACIVGIISNIFGGNK